MAPSTATFPIGRPRADAPEGYRWALVHEDKDKIEQSRKVLPKFRKGPKLEEFKYDRLSNMNKRIRLLTLMAGTDETSEVECQLFEGEISDGRVLLVEDGKAQKDHPISYEALSWSWGRLAPEFQILIRKGAERREKKASEDLVWALRYLRYADRDRVLWIDALCINQESVEEKNHQVQMMAQIYSYASSVCIWLGLGDRESHMAIAFIQDEILKLEQFDELCQDERNSQKWQSLLVLMQRPWFFRRWVVQEIALARDAVIYCGPDKIAWKDFSVAVELFVEVETATHRLSEVMKKDPRFYHVPGWFEYVSALGASLLVEATGMIFRYYKSKESSSATLPSTPNKSPKSRGRVNTPTVNKKRRSDGPEPESGSDPENEDEEDDGWGGWDDPHLSEDEEKPAVSAENEKSRGKQEPQNSKAAGNGSKKANPQEKPSSPGLSAPNADASSGENSAAGPSEDPISRRRPLLSLEYLVSRLSIFEATEPRDAIYALLAIANDGYPAAEGSGDDVLHRLHGVLGGVGGQQKQKAFPVDYGRPYADVCQDFIEFCIKKTDTAGSGKRGGKGEGSSPNRSREEDRARERTDRTRALDIICRPWAPEPKPGISIHYNRRRRSDHIKRELVEWRKKVKKVHREDRRDEWMAAKSKIQAGEDLPNFEDFLRPPWTKHFTPAAGKTQPDKQKEGREDELPPLPTWIPRLEGAPFAMHHQAGIHIMKMGRKNADPLVGFPNSQRNYDAAQGTEVDMETLRFRKSMRFGFHSMFVKGFVLDKIRSTANSSQSGNIPGEWLGMAGWNIKEFTAPDDDSGPPDEFWRTLVADRGRDSRNPPYYYMKACKESIYKGGLSSGSVNTSDLINNERNSIVAQFCRRVQAVIWNRSMVKTEQGHLGVACKTVKPGDLVCIFYGCSVPVILREKKKTAEERDVDSEEDEAMQEFESTMRNGMAKMKARKRRANVYKKIPEDTPNEWTEEDKKHKWTRKQLRGWRAGYDRKNAERKHQGENSATKQQGVPGTQDSDGLNERQEEDYKKRPRVPRDFYYEFLGECYIHGMMDGEAMGRKSKFDEDEVARWNDTRASRSSEEKKREIEDNIKRRKEYYTKKKANYEQKVDEWRKRDQNLTRKLEKKAWEDQMRQRRRSTQASIQLLQGTTFPVGGTTDERPAAPDEDDNDGGKQGAGEPTGEGLQPDRDGIINGSGRRTASLAASPDAKSVTQFSRFGSANGKESENGVANGLRDTARVVEPPWRLRKRAEASPDKLAEADAWDLFRDKMLHDTIFELR